MNQQTVGSARRLAVHVATREKITNSSGQINKKHQHKHNEIKVCPITTLIQRQIQVLTNGRMLKSASVSRLRWFLGSLCIISGPRVATKLRTQTQQP